MNRFFKAVLFLAVMLCASTVSAKTLVVYFSWGGTTERLAYQIQKSTGADIFRIEAEEPYPSSYTPTTKAAKEELEKNIFRKVKGSIDFSSYDTVFAGAPVWWHTAPMIVQGFLKDNAGNLAGKTVIPFVTYASTYRDETLAKITELTPDSKHLEGFGTRSPSQSETDAWLKKIGQLKPVK